MGQYPEHLHEIIAVDTGENLYDESLESDNEELWNADPDCKHNIISASGGGVRCTKCKGWFCY